MKPDNIILEGVTGSTAYGLNHENSDIDIKGVYLLPTKDVLSVRHNPEKTTVVNTDPDWAYHEVGKFMKLVAGGNPTVSELLWLEDYTVLSPVGKLLVDNRQMFLSTPAVMKAYRGYALGQAKRLSNRQAEGLEGFDSSTKNRFAKHTRHCFRLLLQCRQLLETGTLTVKVTPEQREWLFKMGEQTPETVVDSFIAEDSKMENIKSVLPASPDWKAIDALLYQIRTDPPKETSVEDDIISEMVAAMASVEIVEGCRTCMHQIINCRNHTHCSSLGYELICNCSVCGGTGKPKEK